MKKHAVDPIRNRLHMYKEVEEIIGGGGGKKKERRGQASQKTNA